jgi:hypothetical protein
VFSGKKVDGTQRWFIGTATNIYESNSTGSSLTDRSLTTYSASATQTWSFCQFGDVTLATNLGNVIGQSSSGTFATVTGAPKAQIIINAGPPTSPFILAMNYDDGVTPNKAGIFNSAIADYTGWTVGTLQSAQFTIYEPSGPILAGIAYRDGAIVFKGSSMFELTYSAIQTTPGWGARRIASDIGIAGKNMCVNVNDTIYFADKRGIWMYDGSYPKKLSGYIHDFWATQVANGYVDDSCQMVWDPTKHNLWVSHRTSASSTTEANWLVWNQLSGLWARQATISKGSNPYRTARQIIAFEPTPLATTIDGTTWTVDTFTYDQSTVDNTTTENPPQMVLWAIGDPIGYTEVKRIAPVWLRGLSPATSSSVTLFAGKRQGTSVADSNTTATIDANKLYFDFTLSANWIQPELDIYGAYEFGAVGISSQSAGQRGTR